MKTTNKFYTNQSARVKYLHGCISVDGLKFRSFQDLTDELYYHYDNELCVCGSSTVIVGKEHKLAVQYCHIRRDILDVYYPFGHFDGDSPLNAPREEDLIPITEHRLDPCWVNDYDAALIIPFSESVTVFGCFMNYFEANHQYIDSVLEVLRKRKGILVLGSSDSSFSRCYSGVKINKSISFRVSGTKHKLRFKLITGVTI